MFYGQSRPTGELSRPCGHHCRGEHLTASCAHYVRLQAVTNITPCGTTRPQAGRIAGPPARRRDALRDHLPTGGTHRGTTVISVHPECLYVACGEEVALHRVAEVFIAFSGHGRRVVRADETVGGVFQGGPQEFDHVSRAVVVERFAETRLVARHVAEMEEENPLAEFWNQFENIFPHRTESGLAERDTMRRTVAERHCATIGVRACQNAGITKQWRQRRIVRMQAHLHAGGFGGRHHGADEIGVIVPKLFFRKF